MERARLSSPALAKFWRDAIHCHVCTTIAPWRKFRVASRGTARHRLMLLGEAPGRVSLEHGRAFSNPRNLTIRQAFARAVAPKRWELEDVFYITDVVKCWPAKAGRANRSPRPAEVKTCVERHLRHEIEILRPRLIVAFGALAARAAIGRSIAVAESHGRVITSADGIRVLTFTHPSSINITGMRRVGLRSLAEYEDQLSALLRTELAKLIDCSPRKAGE
jgi:uracil-DNA glycosylase family 4